MRSPFRVQFRPRWAGRLATPTLFLFAVAPFSGCQQPMQPEGPTVSTLSADDDLDQLWNTALSVLRKVDFQPDRQDRAAGVITCFPTTSAQWHEFWRQDAGSAYGLLESSLNTIQRKATVKFINNNGWTLDVQIEVYRLSRPETQITTASSVLHGFAGRLPTDEGAPANARTGDHWVRLGRDGPLEERILNRILNEADASVADSPMEPAAEM